MRYSMSTMRYRFGAGARSTQRMPSIPMTGFFSSRVVPEANVAKQKVVGDCGPQQPIACRSTAEQGAACVTDSDPAFVADHVQQHLDEWRDDGAFVAASLGFQGQLDSVQLERIYRYYLPIFYWTMKQLNVHNRQSSGKPLVLGISAPQGCGKTTIVEELQKLMGRAGKRCASVSIDDFYLRNCDQLAVASGSPHNRLLQCRGNAGTHDLDLGSETLRQLTNLGADQSMLVPRYDKSAFSGAGDRAEESSWPSVQGPLDVVLFEGWMLGFSPVGKEMASSIDESLGAVDDALCAYADAWDSYVDAWLVVKVGDPQWVFNWRLQAEVAMRTSGKAGMTDEQVADFVSRYIPAYSAYLPALYSAGPTTVKPGKWLTVEVNSKRSPVSAVAK